jgi:hypothetical protein
MSKFEKIIVILKEMILKKFSGRIQIEFSQGGIRGIKKISEENIKI